MILSYAKSFDKMNKDADKQLGIVRFDSTKSGGYTSQPYFR